MTEKKATNAKEANAKLVGVPSMSGYIAVDGARKERYDDAKYKDWEENWSDIVSWELFVEAGVQFCKVALRLGEDEAKDILDVAQEKYETKIAKKIEAKRQATLEREKKKAEQLKKSFANLSDEEKEQIKAMLGLSDGAETPEPDSK